MSSKGKLKVDWVSIRAARYACERWHYAKCLPRSKKVCLGAWEDGEFVGVAIFGFGACSTLVTRYGLKRSEGVELLRVAMKEHRVPVTRFISVSIRLLKRRFPSIRLIIAYADQNQGHDGTIYQAGNWVYTGESSKGVPVFRTPAGKVVHSRVVSKTGVREHFGRYTPCYKIDDCERISQLPKHRYAYPLDKEIRERIEAPQPFVGCKPKGAVFEGSPEEAVQALTEHLSDDLRRAKYRGASNRLAGHCYVISEALRWLLGDEWLPMFIKHEDDSHWFLRHCRTGEILDPTASQFKTPVPHKQARRQAFLTKRPSKRAVVLLRRAGFDLCAGSIDSDVPGDQPGEGGANPTSALFRQ